jgi:hypothetical protein
MNGKQKYYEFVFLFCHATKKGGKLKFYHNVGAVGRAVVMKL